MPPRQQEPFRPEQKREYLERGEVRTMAKDIARLREEEAKKEQQRIAQLKAQQNAQREKDAVAKIRSAALAAKQREETRKEERMRNIQSSILPPGEENRFEALPTPPSRSKRVLVRAIIVIIFAFIVLNIGLFLYWFVFQNQSVEIPFLSQFFSQEQTTPTPTPPPASGPSPQPPPQAQPAPTPSDPLGVAHTSTLLFSEKADLTSTLKQSLEADQQEGFTKLVFRNRQDNTTLESTNSFFGIFEVPVPEAVSNQLQQTSFFFLYSYERGNRFGIVSEVADPTALWQGLRAWEPQMEQAFVPLRDFWGSPGNGYTKSFRSTSYNGAEVRFQTFSTQDVGIVYTIVNNRFILASSFEAIKEAIDELQNSPGALLQNQILAVENSPGLFKPPQNLSLEQAIGQVLLIGFEGTYLTPELEELMKRLRPGGVLLLARNITDSQQLQKLTQELQALSLEYSSLPLLVAVDQEGGLISRIQFGKEKTAQSTIETPAQAYAVGKERARELKSLGVNLNLAPVLDTTGPHDFLFERTFQTEGLEAGRLARALLAGQKSENILSTLKHFPGYGSISFNPEKKLATVQEFPDISPFAFALSSEPEFLLTSNVIYSTVDKNYPFSFSIEGMSLIREELGFQGIILSDDLAQPALLDNYSFEEIVFLPLRAGMNILMFAETPEATQAHKLLLQQAATDETLRKQIEASANRVLDLKKKFFFPSEEPLQFNHLSQNK